MNVKNLKALSSVTTNTELRSLSITMKEHCHFLRTNSYLKTLLTEPLCQQYHYSNLPNYNFWQEFLPPFNLHSGSHIITSSCTI